MCLQIRNSVFRKGFSPNQVNKELWQNSDVNGANCKSYLPNPDVNELHEHGTSYIAAGCFEPNLQFVPDQF